MKNFRRVAAISSTVMVAALLSGCATKSFVRDQVAAAQKEQSAQQQKDHQAAMDALNSAASKQSGVDSAQDGRITTADQTANEALQRAEAAGKLAEGKFNYTVVMSDASVKFSSDKSALSDAAKAKLTQLAQQLKSENKNVYLEIQGYTDSRGSAAMNMKLGEARAVAAYRFLHEQGIALNRMATISYGEEHPVATNKTRAGRAENRRIAIVVLN